MDVADRRTDGASHYVRGSGQRKGRSVEFGVASNEHANSRARLDRENDVLNV
jgi:hypothetical protein